MNDTFSIIRPDSIDRKALYEHLYGKMMALCLRYSKNKEQAKNILHEGILKVFKDVKNKTFSNNDSLDAWIHSIMVNTAIDYLRKNKKEYMVVRTVYGNEQQNKSSNTDELTILKNLNEGNTLKAIQELSPAYRVLFNLYIVEGYSYEEIAKKLDVSEGICKVNLEKAKANFKRNLINTIKD